MVLVGHLFTFFLYFHAKFLNTMNSSTGKCHFLRKQSIYTFCLCIILFFLQKLQPKPKNILARKLHLKIALLAIAKGSLGREMVSKTLLLEEGQNNNNNKPKAWRTSGGWTKRVENLVLSLENLALCDNKECTTYFLLKIVNFYLKVPVLVHPEVISPGLLICS